MVQDYISGAYLVIHSGNNVGKRVELWKESTTIGRSRECDIFIEDIAVHRKQASIVRMEAGYLLRDDHGSGDSFVNGQSAQEQILSNGDKLLFGQTTFIFYANEGTRPFQLPSSRGKELHIVKRPDDQAHIVARLEQQDARTGMLHTVELLSDMTIGRSRECDIFLEDLAVSRLHATMKELTDGRFELTDNRSATGTFVNGQAIAQCILRPGDSIQIGASRFTFRHAEAR
jgi:pSer/pThr/pTyr-binding forkhead associated (FHA) protein